MSTEEEDYQRLKGKLERLITLNWWLVVSLLIYWCAVISASALHFLDRLPGK